MPQGVYIYTYRDSKRNADFSALEEMERPSVPTLPFKLASPSWSEFKAIVRKKRNGAAAGLNGISYVPYKKCEPLLLRLYWIVKRILKTSEVPADWGSAYMVLIPKENDLTNPELFRNIAVTNTNGKIYFSVISRNLEDFMVKNQYIDRSVQKGFLQGMAGCVEHTFSLHHLLKDAFQHHRQIIVSWIDLANAYGSIMHNLIQFALEWYHVPVQIREIIFNYYECLCAKVVTKDWSTDFFPDDIGLFQGCVLSTILFDIVFNLLLDFIKPLDKLGYRMK